MMLDRKFFEEWVPRLDALYDQELGLVIPAGLAIRVIDDSFDPEISGKDGRFVPSEFRIDLNRTSIGESNLIGVLVLHHELMHVLTRVLAELEDAPYGGHDLAWQELNRELGVYAYTSFDLPSIQRGGAFDRILKDAGFRGYEPLLVDEPPPEDEFFNIVPRNGCPTCEWNYIHMDSITRNGRRLSCRMPTPEVTACAR